ncbi:delta 1-pyrroline-5-carboxylate reductase [Fusarium oxysporum]|nr:delta 1-pyrroline-5-carboxylate reductase [Fusarium oxysporum]
MSPNTMALTPYGSNGSTDLTMAVLGCGTMGVAILSGILNSLAEMQGPKPLQSLPRSGTSTPGDEVPERLPSRFVASVATAAGAKRVKGALWEHSSILKVVHNDNIGAVQQAEVVLLTCKPWMVKEILSEPGISKALHGKLLVSVCAGITVEDIEIALHGAVPSKDPEEDGRCRIVRAMCNTAAVIRESMTVIASPSSPSTMPPRALLPGSSGALVTLSTFPRDIWMPRQLCVLQVPLSSPWC